MKLVIKNSQKLTHHKSHRYRLVKCFMNISSGQPPMVPVQSSALPWSCLVLLGTVVCLVMIFKCYDWELNWQVGMWLLAVYALFVVSATYLEYNFGETGFSLLTIFKGENEQSGKASIQHHLESYYLLAVDRNTKL